MPTIQEYEDAISEGNAAFEDQIVTVSPDLEKLALKFTASHGVAYHAETIERYLQSFDESLGESIEEHLECFADHDLLTFIINRDNA